MLFRSKLEELKNSRETNIYSDKLAQELHHNAMELAEMLISYKDLVDQAQIIRSLSLVTNLERIADSLNQTSPAITKVDSPEFPESQGIISLAPVETSLKLSKRLTKKIQKLF